MTFTRRSQLIASGDTYSFTSLEVTSLSRVDNWQRESAVQQYTREATSRLEFFWQWARCSERRLFFVFWERWYEVICVGHHLLVIAPVVRLSYRNRKMQPSRRTRNGPPPPSPPAKTKSTSSSNTNGENIALLSNELHLLRVQIDRLNSLVDQHHHPPPPASITQPASTSFVPDIEPT